MAFAAYSHARAAEDILDGLGEAKKPAAPADVAAAPAGGRAQESPSGKPPVAETAPGAVAQQVAAAPSKLDRIKAVPRKTLLKRHRFELSPFGTLSLNDAYYQHLAVGGAAVFFPHDSFGFGVGAEYLLAHLSTNNVDAVRENLTSVPAVARLDLPYLFAHVDAYWVPLYGKLSLFSDDIIQFEVYAVSGLGVAFTGDHYQPAVNLGIGQRFMLGDWLALRFEVRDHLFVETLEVNGFARSDVQSYVLFMAGVSVFLPTRFEYSFQ